MTLQTRGQATCNKLVQTWEKELASTIAHAKSKGVTTESWVDFTALHSEFRVLESFAKGAKIDISDYTKRHDSVMKWYAINTHPSLYNAISTYHDYQLSIGAAINTSDAVRELGRLIRTMFNDIDVITNRTLKYGVLLWVEEINAFYYELTGEKIEGNRTVRTDEENPT